MRALAALVAKDLRLLWRDRVALVFLVVAPFVVIVVAGFSLATLYGSDPTGRNAYDVPLVDEDGGRIARELQRRLGGDAAVHVVPVASREEAYRLVREKRAGTALVIPPGTDAALERGDPAAVVLYTDAVKYLERLNVRVRLLELGERLARERRADAVRAAAATRAEVEAQLARLRDELETARARLDDAWRDAARARGRAVDAARAQLGQAVEDAATRWRADAEARLAAPRAALAAWLAQVDDARRGFDAWMQELRRLAGRHADDLPPPPAFPEPPPALLAVARDGLALPPPPAFTVPAPALPPLPAPPELAVDLPTLPAPPAVPGPLEVIELDAGGGSLSVNTFDQNVPGFSVTFLLLGMLLGVSLQLLDEEAWGTLDRLRAMPVSTWQVLLAKLVSRFVVGVVQMALLLAIGRAAFRISLGPQPWALALPVAGIVWAGTCFGLVVAALATSREAVLPLGSIVIVTMAAVGGCWWPIDLEPRWMREVALAFPTTWAMDAFNDLMIRRRDVSSALRPAAVLATYGALYLVVGVGLFHWRRLGSWPRARPEPAADDGA